MKLYPELIEVCGNLLPDDVAREISGTQDSDSTLGSTGTVEGDRKRRADSEVRSAESSAKVGITKGKRAKVEDPTNGMSAHFKEVISTVMEVFKPEPSRVESTTGGSSAETAENACASLNILDAHMNSHEKSIESLEREKAKGDKANQTRLGVLQDHAAALEAKIRVLVQSGL